jgi:pimeloyl-ACP methyl ester carboxylesterase
MRQMWTIPEDWSIRVPVPGADLHAIVAGQAGGRDVLLLHGWPEYCGVWRRLIPELAGAGRLIAPDLRDFGYSSSTDGPGSVMPTPAVLAGDVLALLDTLASRQTVIVSHDIGAFVAQHIARSAPGRVEALVFFDCPNPGLGARYGAPDHAIETWYQHFQRLQLAVDLVGHSAHTCRLYLAHFLGHLAADAAAFADVLDEWVAVYMQPGKLAGSFAWYEAVWPQRKAMIEGALAPLPPIPHRTRILWGMNDPVTPLRWSDRLDETFCDFVLSGVPGAGHFPHWQQPALVGREIRAFLDTLP